MGSYPSLAPPPPPEPPYGKDALVRRDPYPLLPPPPLPWYYRHGDVLFAAVILGLLLFAFLKP